MSADWRVLDGGEVVEGGVEGSVGGTRQWVGSWWRNQVRWRRAYWRVRMMVRWMASGRVRWPSRWARASA